MEQLTDREAGLIIDLLSEYLADLRMEIADTDDFEFRQGLKKKAETLRQILEKLERSMPVTVH